MRPIHLFIVGLLFLTATLLGLGLLFFRTFPARASSADNVPVEDLQPPSGLLPGSTMRHRVADGEWLNQIVRCYGANYQEVLSANPDLVDPAQLLPATVLTIPHIGSSGRIYGPPCITFHIVQSGDSWSSLAQRYNADVGVMEAVNCLLEVGAALKIPLNSAGGQNSPSRPNSTGTTGNPILLNPTGTPGSPVSPDPTERIPRFSISASSPSVSYSGIVPPLGKACVDLNASEVQTLNIQVNADGDSAIKVAKPDGAVSPPTDTALSLSESKPQAGKYRVVIASTSRDAIIRFTLEANIKTSVSATKTVAPEATPTRALDATPTPTGATPTEAAATGSVVPIPSTSVPEPPLLIEAEWPKRLAVGQSGRIRISLLRVSDKAYVATVEMAGHTASVSTAINIGTPGVSEAAALGPDYQAFAIAYLAASAFEVRPGGPESQSLDQPNIVWTWNILSDQASHQVIDVRIEIQWKAKNGSGVPIQRMLWRSSPPLDIEVYRPVVTTGQLSLFTVLSGSIGSGLSIPFLYGIVKERGKKMPQKPKRKSRST
jgi:LysM repeat protein